MLGQGGNPGVSLPPLCQTSVTHTVATQYSRSSLLYDQISQNPSHCGGLNCAAEQVHPYALSRLAPHHNIPLQETCKSLSMMPSQGRAHEMSCSCASPPLFYSASSLLVLTPLNNSIVAKPLNGFRSLMQLPQAFSPKQ